MGKNVSHVEELLFFQIKMLGLPLPMREYRFYSKRKWRSDFVWPAQKLIVEVEGGIFTAGRHVRPNGYQKDCEKYNMAARLGYAVLRFTPHDVKKGTALVDIESFLKKEKENEKM